MASSSKKRVRFGFDMKFVNLEAKEAFVQRLEHVRQLMTPAGAPSLDNNSLFNVLCDLAEASHPTLDPHSANVGQSTSSFMRNSGKSWKNMWYESFSGIAMNYILF